MDHTALTSHEPSFPHKQQALLHLVSVFYIHFYLCPAQLRFQVAIVPPIPARTAMPATFRGILRKARADAWAHSKHQSFLLFFWWSFQMNMAITGIWALSMLEKPNAFQALGPGMTDFSEARNYYIEEDGLDKKASVHYLWFAWLTLALCVISLFITMIENILSIFNRLSRSQLKRDEWTKAILWFVWFTYIGFQALDTTRKFRREGRFKYRMWPATVDGESWPRVLEAEAPYPNGSSVLCAFCWAFPFWLALPIMWMELRKGLFPKPGEEQSPAIDDADVGHLEEQDSVLNGTDGGGPGDHRGHDGAHDSTEIVQPSQRSLEETHPAYASSL